MIAYCDADRNGQVSLKELKWLDRRCTKVSDAGRAKLAAVLNSGALPALDTLKLDRIPASDRAKAAVNEALVRLPAALERLSL